MLISGVSWDLNLFLQFIFTALVLAVGLHTLVKNTASKYFEVDASFEGDHSSDPSPMPSALVDEPICAVCGNRATKKCSRCKAVRYCSRACQQSHWRSGHKAKCTSAIISTTLNGATSRCSIALIPGCTTSKPIIITKKPTNILFPYDEFVKFFNWDKPGSPPCGLLNCGNSCFANVVLQCLSFTKPLAAYLLEVGHCRECNRNDWCFLCEFEKHVEKIRLTSQAFSPVNILSRLPNIGGALGYGRQEDAHEFMRVAIDTMQSVCLDEFGGEKAVSPNLQETTLIQHIFGGHLQSEVICTKCDKISNQYENMMDLTVEIHGDAASLEECLDQFTVKEWLHGENMYKCDGCEDYVMAWKRFTVKRAPNILTVALKRFLSGRFGKLNKRVTFPETLDLSSYMSEAGDGSDIYKLYAVVVHIDMLNASFFGHYICYIKDFLGKWYRIDDWKVTIVELEEVLSQGAYMLLYSRVSARPSGLQSIQSSGTAEVQTVGVDMEPGPTEQAECLPDVETVTCSRDCELLPSDDSPDLKEGYEYVSSTRMISDTKREHFEVTSMIDIESTNVANASYCCPVESAYIAGSQAIKDFGDVDMGRSIDETSGCSEEQDDTDMVESGPSPGLPNHFSCFDKDSSVSMGYHNVREDSVHEDVVQFGLMTGNGNAIHGNGCASANKTAVKVCGCEHYEDIEIDVESTHNVANGSSCSAFESSYMPSCQALKDLGAVKSLEEISGSREEQDDTDMAKSGLSPELTIDFPCLNKDSCVSMDYQNLREDAEHIDVVEFESMTAKGDAIYGNGYANRNKSAIPVEDAGKIFSGIGSFPTETDVRSD